MNIRVLSCRISEVTDLIEAGLNCKLGPWPFTPKQVIEVAGDMGIEVPIVESGDDSWMSWMKPKFDESRRREINGAGYFDHYWHDTCPIVIPVRYIDYSTQESLSMLRQDELRRMDQNKVNLIESVATSLGACCYNVNEVDWWVALARNGENAVADQVVAALGEEFGLVDIVD